MSATQGVDKELLWSARSLGASERQLLWEIILPAALPQILTGLQVALPISLIVAIVTEMLMGGAGLGGAMIAASRFANSPGVFAGIVEIANCRILPGQRHRRAAPPSAALASGGAGRHDVLGGAAIGEGRYSNASHGPVAGGVLPLI